MKSSHIRIVTRDVRVGDYILGRCIYGSNRKNKGQTTSADGDNISECGHTAFYSMKLLQQDRQRKNWQRLAAFCGNMVKELNNNEGGSLGSLGEIAYVQTNKVAREIRDIKNKKHG